jgi:hypothetical protein
MGVDLANQPQFIQTAKQYPDQIQALCTYLEKQPFQVTLPNSPPEPFPTTDCSPESIHLGCVAFLTNKNK